MDPDQSADMESVRRIYDFFQNEMNKNATRLSESEYKTKLESEVNAVKESYEKIIKELQTEHDAKIETLESEFKDKLTNLEEEYQYKLKTKVGKQPVDICSMIVKSYNSTPLDDIHIVDNAFTDVEIELIKDLAKKIPSSQATVGKSMVDKSMRKSTLKWIDRANPEYDFIYIKICQMFINANKMKFDVNLSGMTESIQYTIYNAEDGPGYYHFHSDLGKVASQRKLSISVQLSDEKDYDGGELQFQIVREPFSVTKKKGTAIIFPSFLQHRVLPVTRGERISLVCWISGPPYK